MSYSLKRFHHRTAKLQFYSLWQRLIVYITKCLFGSSQKYRLKKQLFFLKKCQMVINRHHYYPIHNDKYLRKEFFYHNWQLYKIRYCLTKQISFIHSPGNNLDTIFTAKRCASNYMIVVKLFICAVECVHSIETYEKFKIFKWLGWKFFILLFSLQQ